MAQAQQLQVVVTDLAGCEALDAVLKRDKLQVMELYSAWAGPTQACRAFWRKMALENGGILPCDLSTACLDRCGSAPVLAAYAAGHTASAARGSSGNGSTASTASTASAAPATASTAASARTTESATRAGDAAATAPAAATTVSAGTSEPRFLLFRAGKQVAEVVGVDLPALMRAVQEHLGDGAAVVVQRQESEL